MSQMSYTDKFQRLQVGMLKIHNKSFPIYEGLNTIGRNKEAIVNIKHLSISQNHAAVVVINEVHFISDLNSSNGSFLEDRKVEPFKLFELKNKTSVKLGNLCGTYFSEGPFANNCENHFEMTQDITQSFYGSSTQILDNLQMNYTENETEDIHEAPTQEISLAKFKIPKSIKSTEKSINETSTQRNNSRLENTVRGQEEDIHSCDTQVICGSSISKNEKTNKLEKFHDKKLGDIVDDIGEDIHDAPTQVLPLLSNNSDNTILPESEFFGPFNDEELPLLEDNDNYVEIHEIPEIDKTLDIHEAVTQVIDISKKIPISNCSLDDDEATDCEDHIDETANIKSSGKCSRELNLQKTSQDEITDCEDNTQDNQFKPISDQEDKSKFLESDNDSNDSIEFFKLDRSINKESKDNFIKFDVVESDGLGKVAEKSKVRTDPVPLGQCNVVTESSSDETIHFKKKKILQVTSDSDTDDEVIGFRKNKKSSMVISTQDIGEKEPNEKSVKLNDKKVRNRDSYVINDTDSETEIDTASKNYLEESIPATQDHLPTDLNDTDCIPATQEVVNPLPIKSMVRSPKNTENTNGSSEESFKLGLTELMMNPSQAVNDGASSQDPCCSKNLSPAFVEPNFKKNEIVINTYSDDTDKTDIYLAPTQQNQNLKSDGNNIQSDDTDKTDIYLAPTQQNQHLENDDDNKKLTDSQSDFDTYLAPTQKISMFKKVDNTKEKPLDNLNETEFLYEVATQKIYVDETKCGVDTGTQLNATNDDIYLAPTQKINVIKNKHQTDKVDQLDATNDDIYFAPTQKFSKITDTDQNSSRDDSMDALYLQPTQQLEDTFNQPTQKVNKANLETESSSEDKKRFSEPNLVTETSDNVALPGKKKFSFKKKESYLDGSLTSLLDPNPKHEQLQTVIRREDRSSIELEFVQTVDASAESPNRPSNPLSHILENFCELGDTIKPKNKETRIGTDEVPEQTKTVSGNDTNKNERTDKLHFVTNETKTISYKNENKLDCGKMNSSRDHIVEKKSDAAFEESSKEQVTLKLTVPPRSLRTRQTSKLITKTNLNLNKLKPQTENEDKNTHVNSKLDIKPKARRTTRRLSSSSSATKSCCSDLDDEKKSRINLELTDNSLNITSSEVNQSVALLESKVTKTRRTMKSTEIQVKVPKNRKSMAISKIDETPESLNNNVIPKSDQETKESIADYDIKPSSFSTNKSNLTTKTRGRPKRKQSAVRLVQDNKTTNKSLKEDGNSEVLKNDHNECLKDSNISASASKDDATCSKRGQSSKRKQLSKLKLDDSDGSTQSIDGSLNTPKKQKLQPSRQVSKRKHLSEAKGDNSDSSIQSVDNNLVTPKKQKIQLSEVLLNTKERGLRKQRPKVVFTMLESPQMESMIKQLGGSVIDSVDACTVLVTEHVKRSQKLLSAVGLGKPICSPKWITDSKKAHEFLDPWDYILTDPEAEKKWNFSLKESLNRSRTRKLLNSYNFQIMVTNAADVLKGAIESCGGKCISKIPSQPQENTFIISVPESQNKYKRFIKQHSNIKVLEPEAIFDGVLRQELRFSKHYLT